MNHLIIIGGGNSIRAFPGLWDDVIGHDVMTVNHAYRFAKELPKYQVSIDRKFWKENAGDMDMLEAAGCKLINRDRECPMSKAFRDDVFFCGARKLSGVFALSYATRKLNYNTIYLFGFDFGVVAGKTHFYDSINHSGIGKGRAYMDEKGETLGAANDFDYFTQSIFTVGETNITAFKNINYSLFKLYLRMESHYD